MTTKHETCSIIGYSNLLQTLWHEMNYYQCIQTKCSDNIALFKRFAKKESIYDFLVGLDFEFGTVPVQILEKKDLPSLNEVIAIARVEEGKRGVMLESPTIEGSALVSTLSNAKNLGSDRYFDESKKQSNLLKPNNKDSFRSNYCKKAHHIIDKCWKLYDKHPKNGQSKGQG